MTSSQIIFRGLTGVFMSLLVMFVDALGGMRWLRGGIEMLMKPELHVIERSGRGVSGVSESVKFAFGGQEKLTALQKQLALLEQQLVEEKDIAAENASLKKVLGAANSPKDRFRLISARVVSSGAFLVIENNHFSAGQIVLSPEGTLIGVIDHVGAWNARIKQPADAQWNSTVSIMLLDNNEVSGELHGSFGTNMTVEKVSSQVELSPGLLVATKGDDDAIPSHLLIGRIGPHINHTDAAVYQSADVIPMVDTSSLSTVMVIASNTL